MTTGHRMAVHVLWDGRRNGPGGAYLCTDEHPIVQPVSTRQPVVMRAVPVSEIVLGALVNGPQTLREIADAHGLDGTNVNSALHQAKKKGLVEVVGVRTVEGGYGRGSNYGRKGESIYALVQERN